MSDGEEAFTLALQKYFPNVRRYRDWGHLFANARRQLKKLQITKTDEVDRYMDDLRSLFSSKSELDYQKAYNQILSDAAHWNDVSF